jgi:hypothetical protein
LDNVSRAWGIFLFIGAVMIMLLLIESWMDVCKVFVHRPKPMIWTVRIINIVIQTVLVLFGIAVCIMLCFNRKTKVRHLAEMLVKFAVYPLFVAILAVLVLEVTIIGVTILVIVKGKLKQRATVIQVK